MERALKKKVVPLLVVCFAGLFLFSRTAGADSVRMMQILLLFTSGLCAGIAVGGVRRKDQPPAIRRDG
jgi:drug/metabolite transporter (DMT)-like permease